MDLQCRRESKLNYLSMLQGSSVGEASARQTGYCPQASKDAEARVTRDSRVKGFPNVAEVERPLRRAVLKLQPVGESVRQPAW